MQQSLAAKPSSQDSEQNGSIGIRTPTPPFSFQTLGSITASQKSSISVKITCVEADLLGKENDVYAVVTLAGVPQKTQTKKSAKPQWNETFNFSMVDRDSVFKVELFSKGKLLGDKCMGETHSRRIMDVLQSSVIQQWIPVYNKKSGHEMQGAIANVQLLVESGGQSQRPSPASLAASPSVTDSRPLTTPSPLSLVQHTRSSSATNVFTPPAPLIPPRPFASTHTSPSLPPRSHSGTDGSRLPTLSTSISSFSPDHTRASPPPATTPNQSSRRLLKGPPPPPPPPGEGVDELTDLAAILCADSRPAPFQS
mmetsp:Transcript_10464/g.17117  ORF Transcript_10464/g.17117 Transcript_10464/m.17117 type:complete len:310 (+) Transcript_10464:213-1142(+)|eukprot:CAMPEP_0184643902 /NCGR_PEP_ID=MMETSP0308-20130426/716_1 /TAXON_ID=38269 /ORGANISM="Gloeochaete witrockiana, Strain SAG 46.84" /LENGTH=309 /DNA_ID=CAMNT_0027072151 /DNA_START=212 /DNA_END=1141 /DNA_ORIENTATION=-